MQKDHGKQYADISEQVTYSNKQVGSTNVTTASYQITDGGPLDQDGQVNGEIKDPAGPAVEIPKPESELAKTGENQGYYLQTAFILMLSTSIPFIAFKCINNSGALND